MKELTRRAGNANESRNGSERLANGLGWFSIGLGLAEVIAPSKVAQLIGVRDEERTRAILRTYGLREITAGIGILSQPQPAGWMWGRVAGDLMDLASLGSALAGDATNRTKLAAATAAVLGITALDLLCGQQLTSASKPTKANKSSGQVKQAIIINRPPDEVYRFWCDLERLPTFMEYLESVRITGDRRSHWVAKGPAGTTYEWDAEMVEDQPNTRIAWHSLDSSEVYNRGTVRFERAAGGRGTLLRVDMQYAPPGGAIGSNIAKLLGGEPGQILEHDLRRLKQILETGEIVRSDASIHRGMHAAQPPSRKEAPEILPSPDVRDASLSFA